jgi:hypothetical protein
MKYLLSGKTKKEKCCNAKKYLDKRLLRIIIQIKMETTFRTNNFNREDYYHGIGKDCKTNDRFSKNHV